MWASVKQPGPWRRATKGTKPKPSSLRWTRSTSISSYYDYETGSGKNVGAAAALRPSGEYKHKHTRHNHRDGRSHQSHHIPEQFVQRAQWCVTAAFPVLTAKIGTNRWHQPV